jgi:hypothetical protein
MTAPDGDLRDVHLLQLPVPLWVATQETADALLREFALISAELHDESLESHVTVPKRLIQLIEALTRDFDGVSSEQEDKLYAAAAARARVIDDLHFRVPVEAAAASRQLGEMFDEADEYCRAGQHLLTLAATDEQVKFRWWYLDQFIDQLAGKPPVAWPDYER